MQMPKLGLGTYMLRGDAGVQLMTRALELGYRHLDTAQMYENEVEVGRAVRAASLPRDQIYVVTKVHQDRFASDDVRESAERSIEKLNVGPADLILCHWPPRGIETAAIIDQMLGLKDAGLCHAIGISNFNVSQMETAATQTDIETNQVEFHPMLDQSRLLAAAKRTGISLTAYMPIFRGEALLLPEVQEIAARIGQGEAAVILAWIMQQGVNVLCKTGNPDRLAGNLAALEITLSEADMTTLTALTSANRRLSEFPEWAPDWEG